MVKNLNLRSFKGHFMYSKTKIQNYSKLNFINGTKMIYFQWYSNRTYSELWYQLKTIQNSKV